MTPNRRVAAMLGIIVCVGIATLALTYARPAPSSPTPAPANEKLYSYLIDVAGWYEITPNESVIATPLDLSIDGLKQLPPAVGLWRGEQYNYGAAVDEWFENPDLAVSNLYRDERGHQVWFSMFGSRGRKSYFLFEHTPVTSYPAAGWTVVASGVTPMPLNNGRIFVQRAILTKGSERRIVFYWYLWSDFNRDPEQGVITNRLHVPVTTTDQDAMDAGTDFLRSLYPQVVPWRRF